MSDSTIWTVLCNCPDEANAQRLAQGLIETRLAACVNILAPVVSIYRWENRIETTTEVPLLIKTTANRYPDLQDWLSREHPYETPEIIALPVCAGLQSYLNWVSAECATEK